MLPKVILRSKINTYYTMLIKIPRKITGSLRASLKQLWDRTLAHSYFEHTLSNMPRCYYTEMKLLAHIHLFKTINKSSFGMCYDISLQIISACKAKGRNNPGWDDQFQFCKILGSRKEADI